jgi:hypothetical protein
MKIKYLSFVAVFLIFSYLGCANLPEVEIRDDNTYYSPEYNVKYIINNSVDPEIAGLLIDYTYFYYEELHLEETGELIRTDSIIYFEKGTHTFSGESAL